MMCCRRKLTRTSIVSTTASFTKCVIRSSTWYMSRKEMCSSSDCITFPGDITSVKWSTSRAIGAQRLHLLQCDGRPEGNGHHQIPDQRSQDTCGHQRNPAKVSPGRIAYWIHELVSNQMADMLLVCLITKILAFNHFWYKNISFAVYLCFEKRQHQQRKCSGWLSWRD